MKKLLKTLVLVYLPFTLPAQGFLGLGSPDLGKKKIESIELVLEEAEKLSPSTVFQMGLMARDKKGKQFKTEGMEGETTL